MANLPGKGKFDRNCNTTVCQKPIKGNNWWNSSTRAYYCEECATGFRGINFWSKLDSGVIICTKVTDPKDQPSFPYEEYKEFERKRDEQRKQFREGRI